MGEVGVVGVVGVVAVYEEVVAGVEASERGDCWGEECRVNLGRRSWGEGWGVLGEIRG